MSHISKVDIEINDLACLKKACQKLGLEFREGQTKFKWYRRQSAEKCLHAIGVPGNAEAYEVGVVAGKNGKGFSLVYDNWQGGKGLETLIGRGAALLKQRYATEVAKKELRKKGLRVTEKVVDGKIRLRATR